MVSNLTLFGLMVVAIHGHAAKRAVAINKSQLVTVTASDPDKLAFDEIVFVKRKPYSSDHYFYCSTSKLTASEYSYSG